MTITPLAIATRRAGPSKRLEIIGELFPPNEFALAAPVPP
jgi:hypothetical protein